MNHRSSAAALPPPAISDAWLSPAEWGMAAFLLSEVALFSTLIVVYLSFVGQDKTSPTPREALSLPLVILNTICLLVSSGTIHVAAKHLRAGAAGAFRFWWFVTIVLGAVFLVGTAYEWYELMTEHHLTISRNLFGSTYYTLVGFHGLHVTIGVLVMLALLAVAWREPAARQSESSVELATWYWHFVDVVWVVVFLVVYVVGRT